MKRKMNRLLYWSVTVFSLTGVLILLRSSLRESNSHFLNLSQSDGMHYPGNKFNVKENAVPFVVPVEIHRIVDKWKFHQIKANIRDKHEIFENEKGLDFVNRLRSRPESEPKNTNRVEPNLPKTNMRKLDEVRTNIVRNISNEVAESRTTIPDSPKYKFNSSNSNMPIQEHLKFNIKTSKLDEQDTNVSQLATNNLLQRTSNLKLDDIFIGVKTTTHYHESRLGILLKTWFQQAKSQTYFFTDGDDRLWQNKTGGHMINTDCGTDHHRQSLCCKFAVMYTKYMDSGKRWFCHLDDDNYLNVPRLVSFLDSYATDKNYYIGRSSLNHPIETADRDQNMKPVSFWFATGGAGFCISRALALNMFPYAGGGSFQSMCNRIRLPDDVTVGFIVDYLINTKLTNIRAFNSHLQSLNFVRGEDLKTQITLSYGLSDQRINIVNVPDAKFTEDEDPTRLLSLHCYLFPEAGICM